MQAVIATSYGSPDVLQLAEVEKPVPKANEVLIKVHAALVTSSDTAFRKGEPFLVKVIYGLSKPRLAIGGVEFAGEIEAVGSSVTLFKIGDQVFGMSPDKFGAYADYMILSEAAPMVTKPANMRYEDAAGVCDGATTALTFLRDTAKLQRGQSILINGASGAVGTYAVQLAKYYGAAVTGVCSGTNIDLVKSLGADQVIDYTQEDFTQNGQTYDVIFDAVGKSSFPRCKDSLAPNGVYLATVPTLGIVWHMAWTTVSGHKKAKFVTAGLMQNKQNLDFLKELFEGGQLKSVIDRSYPLAEIAEAHRYVDTGRKKGNVVILVAD
jgi:NADPH:quinone reductase-like Zn-dependent oxidoreductase